MRCFAENHQRILDSRYHNIRIAEISRRIEVENASFTVEIPFTGLIYLL